MSSETRRRGILFIVSAPSGTGKTTLVERLVKVTPALDISRSFTSRDARAGEADGVDYFFVSRERFVAMREAGQFLEWAEIFGHLYGTGLDETERHLAAGRDLVLVIDVQGARKVRARGVQAAMLPKPPALAGLEIACAYRACESKIEIGTRTVTVHPSSISFGLALMPPSASQAGLCSGPR